MTRVGKAGSKFFDFDFEELATMAVGGLAAKALVNPLGKAVFSGGKYPNLKKWFPLIVKGGLTIGLNMVNDKRAKTAAKGAAVATLFEAAEVFAPKVFAPKLRADIAGYDDDDLINAIEIDLSDIGSMRDDAVLGVGSPDSIVL